LVSERFPRSSQYHPEWVIARPGSGSHNALWLSEWLTSAMELRPGMRVLDLGCGPAMSSIFLHREFGVQVWATDLWQSASENLQRIRDAGVEDGVFPIHADARSLPFAEDFFDAIVCIGAFYYYDQPEGVRNGFRNGKSSAHPLDQCRLPSKKPLISPGSEGPDQRQRRRVPVTTAPRSSGPRPGR
jgi:SAM-dependent methyltransferase